MIKINDKIISIPPYVSTSWSKIAALHMKGSILVVNLSDGDTLHIPGLNEEQIALIFQHHTAYLEKESVFSPRVSHQGGDKLKEMMELIGADTPLQFSFGAPSLENLGILVQHNPAQADAPDLPPEFLQKIETISKIVNLPGEEIVIPKAIFGCNCFHCQISRVLMPEETTAEVLEDVEVRDEDLQFQQWDITQTDKQLFCVTNRLDSNEKYNVFLGDPVGCTCGQNGCEHILAVLKS